MTNRSPQGRGTIRTVRDRAGNMTGFQALLPRHLSTAPRGCKNPRDYQEPVGEPLPTKGEARTLLDAAIDVLRRKGGPAPSSSFGNLAEREIQARKHAALRKYDSEERASKATWTWKSIDKNWLKSCPFYDLPAKAIDTETDVAPFFRYLTDEAETVHGGPLSSHYIHQIAQFVRSVFDRAGVKPNPLDSVELPEKGDPRVPFLDLAAQQRLFGCKDIEIEDRVMIGCGMGLGLRVGELLSLELVDAHLGDDPHVVIRFGGPHHAPPKGGRLRRVELFEPGLGFMRRWLRDHHRGGERVFVGKFGGYMKEWPEKFPGWAPKVGLRHMSSHIMRHSYAVSMLSGTWGYEPKGLDFVQQQLGHAQRSTTENYYGAFEHGTWQREARIMRGSEPAVRRVLTAEMLLGTGAAVDAAEVPKAEPSNENHTETRLAQALSRSWNRSEFRRRISAWPEGLRGAVPQALELAERELHRSAAGEPGSASGAALTALIETYEALLEAAAELARRTA